MAFFEDAAHWNFLANVMDGALYSFAMSFVSLQTVLPILVTTIGGGNIAVGLIPVVWVFGFNVPQVLIMAHVHRHEFQKALVLKTAMAQRIPWLMLAGVVVWTAGGVLPGPALLVFFSVLALAALGGSINLPVWFDLVAKLTPVRRRGRLFGLRMLFGSLLGVAGGGASIYVLRTLSYPWNFALLFMLAFTVMMLSYLWLLSLKEETPSTRAPHVALTVDGLSMILRTRPAFRRYLIADSLLILSTMGAAFYAVAAVQRFGLSASSAGTFTVIMMATTMAASVLLGISADRFGHKVNLVMAAGATLAGSVIAIAGNSAGVYAGVFVCTAVALTALQISRLPFLAELSSETERPLMIAVANLFTAPSALSGVLGGWIADIAGYPAVFGIAGVFALVAFLWLCRAVTEPRTALSE